eukprot:CAMPEP_0177700752 /NCGR_PEP_ID=MMETSP0484_2-20121128/6257_1 /TAXON_ID=354590 /ORGANISM="Rhodomonas lens, Strain RHODO" /LENGTH=175 /DNA_ID=CAMNT_0019211963 /DNA_START=261 /DNA_END=786 /DNA_ORIENTATION=+
MAQGHGSDLTFGGMMASSPEPSPVPFRTPASALHRASGGQPRNFEPVGVGPNVSFDENDMGEDIGMEEIDEDWVGKDWLRGVAELYASTEARGPHTTADLAEFVIRALDFHLGSCVEGGLLPSAIAKTWLLVHILFYDSAGNLALWPLGGHREELASAGLDEDGAMEEDGGAEFD